MVSYKLNVMDQVPVPDLSGNFVPLDGIFHLPPPDKIGNQSTNSKQTCALLLLGMVCVLYMVQLKTTAIKSTFQLAAQ